jgi:hypothetical protein
LQLFVLLQNVNVKSYGVRKNGTTRSLFDSYWEWFKLAADGSSIYRDRHSLTGLGFDWCYYTESRVNLIGYGVTLGAGLGDKGNFGFLRWPWIIATDPDIFDIKGEGAQGVGLWLARPTPWGFDYAYYNFDCLSGNCKKIGLPSIPYAIEALKIWGVQGTAGLYAGIGRSVPEPPGVAKGPGKMLVPPGEAKGPGK